MLSTIYCMLINRLYTKYKKRIFLLIAFSYLLIIVAGCKKPDEVTSGLREKLTNECTPMAKEWFNTNYQKATVETSELFSDGYDCTRCVKGRYKTDGKEYTYLYNCDTGEMLSDEGMGYASSYLEKIVADELGLDGYEKCEVYSLGFMYDVTFVNNRKNGWSDDSRAEKEAIYSEIGMSLNYLPIFADDVEIEKMVINRLRQKNPAENMWIAYYYDNRVKELPEKELNRLFSKYPGLGSVRLVCESEDASIDYENPGEEVIDKDNSQLIDMLREKKSN